MDILKVKLLYIFIRKFSKLYHFPSLDSASTNVLSLRWFSPKNPFSSNYTEQLLLRVNSQVAAGVLS